MHGGRTSHRAETGANRKRPGRGNDRLADRTRHKGMQRQCNVFCARSWSLAARRVKGAERSEAWRSHAQRPLPACDTMADERAHSRQRRAAPALGRAVRAGAVYLWSFMRSGEGGAFPPDATRRKARGRAGVRGAERMRGRERRNGATGPGGPRDREAGSEERGSGCDSGEAASTRCGGSRNAQARDERETDRARLRGACRGLFRGARPARDARAPCRVFGLSMVFYRCRVPAVAGGCAGSHVRRRAEWREGAKPTRGAPLLSLAVPWRLRYGAVAGGASWGDCVRSLAGSWAGSRANRAFRVPRPVSAVLQLGACTRCAYSSRWLRLRAGSVRGRGA